MPANNKGKHSIGCLYYLLARMVLQMRGTISPANPWDVMVDLFFYREPEEAKEQEQGAEFAAAEGFMAVPPPPAADSWDDKASFAVAQSTFDPAAPSAQWADAPGWDGQPPAATADAFAAGYAA